MNKITTVDPLEIAKFAQVSDQWWNRNGPLKTLHDINPARLLFIEHYLQLQDKQVLDLGCGGGILSEALAMKKAMVTGLDADEQSIAAATKHAQDNGLFIDYHCSAVEKFEAPAFDAITCMEMLEHVNEPEAVIAHCVRLLKPGGYLLLSTINRTLQAYASAVIAAEYLLGLLPKQTHDYAKFIKPSELAAMARNAGLEVIGLKGIGYNPLTGISSLQDSVAVNYLMACLKS